MTSVHPMPSEEKAYGERLNMKRRPADTHGAGRAPMTLQTLQTGAGVSAGWRERT
jgi:hypothetical protein